MEKVSDFRINTAECLGRGAFGEVLLAEDGAGKKVAAKRILFLPTNSQNILYEIKALENTEQHENILSYIDSQIDGRFMWIFTEYCEQGELSGYYETHKLELYHKLDICYQSACAIAHLHGLSPPLAHRDIKPNNILITHSAGILKVKLADFGISKIIKDEKTLMMKTICGTESYMAPELFSYKTRKAGYGKSVDIFSLGLVYFTLKIGIPGKPLGSLQVRGQGLGQKMFSLNAASHPVWSPVTFNLDDNPLVLHWTVIISAMVNYEPELRPQAQKVRDQIKLVLDSCPKSLLPQTICEDSHSASGGIESAAGKKRSKKHSTLEKLKYYPSKTESVNLLATMDIGRASRRRTRHKIVVVGGNVGYDVSELCWVLDTPDDGFFWRVFDELPESIKSQQISFSVCAVDDKSFVIVGGGNASHYGAICVRYFVETGQWKNLPNITTPRCSAGLVLFQQVLYLVGGEGNNKTILRSCERFDLSRTGIRHVQQWKPCADMLQEMVFPLVAAAGEGIYVVLNTHTDNKVKVGAKITLQHYSPKQKVWKHCAALPEEVRDTSGASVVGDGGYVYLIGGWDKLCLSYNVNDEDWTFLKPCPSVHSFAAICCAGGKINILGGRDEAGPTVKVEEYDTISNKWRQRSLEMPELILHHHALVLRI